MARLLEELDPGTPVREWSGESVGQIRAVYASGEGRGAEFLLVYWDERDEEALVPAEEVMSIADDGVTLYSSLEIYRELPAFQPERNPILHRLR